MARIAFELLDPPLGRFWMAESGYQTKPYDLTSSPFKANHTNFHDSWFESPGLLGHILGCLRMSDSGYRTKPFDITSSPFKANHRNCCHDSWLESLFPKCLFPPCLPDVSGCRVPISLMPCHCLMDVCSLFHGWLSPRCLLDAFGNRWWHSIDVPHAKEIAKRSTWAPARTVCNGRLGGDTFD